MPTAEQSWLKRFNTYYAATEQNKKLFSKRIKQLLHMLKDESFLEYLLNTDDVDVLTFLLNSKHFDDYIMVNEYDSPYIQDNEFGLISYMKTMVGAFQSDHYMLESNMRAQSKVYVKLYVQFREQKPTDDITKLRDAFKTGQSLPF